MPLKINIIKFFFVFTFFIFQGKVHAELNFDDDPDLKQKIKYFQASCDDEDIKEIYKDNRSRPNRLLLIDATDPLSEGQKQYLLDNLGGSVQIKRRSVLIS